MNTKVGNVIVVELGILIVILAWMAFSNLSRVKQPMPAEEQEPADSSFATVTSFPRPVSSVVSRAITCSMPPYPSGGTWIHGGASIATLIASSP